MNSARIKMLEQLILEDPTDPFNRYALGLELVKGEKQKAKEIFEGIMRDHPAYVPVYYQAAILLLELGLNAQAGEIIGKGLTYAKAEGNTKTVSELNALLDDSSD